MDPQIAQQVGQGAPTFINWSLNIWDLLSIGVCAVILYSRLTTLETKIEPIWRWWNESAERRASERLG